MQQIQRKAVWLRTRLGFLQRCTWAVKDQDKILELTKELEGYNNSLHFLCPDGAVGPLRLISATNHITSQGGNKVGLALDKSIAEELYAGGTSMAKETYGAIADMTSIRSLAERIGQPLNEESRKKLLNLQRNEFEAYKMPNDRVGMFAMAIWRGRESNGLAFERAVMIEFKSYLDDKGLPDQGVQDNVLKLGYLVMAPKAPLLLRTRACYGLFKDSDTRRIGFVYKLPGNLYISLSGHRLTPDALGARRPLTLTEAMTATKGISLNKRIALARELLESVITMHATGWVHKNIRPTSVIFFPKDNRPIDRSVIEWQRVNLMGWGFSRHAEFYHHGTTQGQRDAEQNKNRGPNYTTLPGRLPPVANIFGNGEPVSHFAPVDTNITLDMYQHPDKQFNPMRVYEPAYDIYSLGLILLEIGLWKGLEAYVAPAKLQHPLWNGDDVHRFILSQIVPTLEISCGEIYMDVVKTCLEMRSNEGLSLSKQNEQSQRCLRMVARLARCNV